MVYAANSFEIMVVNDPACTSASTCNRHVEIFQGDDTISLHTGANGPEITWNNQVHNILRLHFSLLLSFVVEI